LKFAYRSGAEVLNSLKITIFINRVRGIVTLYGERCCW